MNVILVWHISIVFPPNKIYFFIDLTFYGVLMLAQKSASQFGDGEGALAMWKNSIADYNDENKVSNQNFEISWSDWMYFQPKYRICAHRKIAACAGVFGAKVRTDTLHNCYVNDQGNHWVNCKLQCFWSITGMSPWNICISWLINEVVNCGYLFQLVT